MDAAFVASAIIYFISIKLMFSPGIIALGARLSSESAIDESKKATS